MVSYSTFLFLAWHLPVFTALRYTPDQVDYNLNTNETAVDPLDYWGQWEDHDFQPSPKNWRMPTYTLTLDRFVNGDPTNDDANGTVWEHDITSNQFRFGGDIRGVQDTLDYIQGMGVKVLYLAGSPHINMPWGSDGYSPLDLTLLDHHHGVIDDWRAVITEIHNRGMYVIFDNTMATMGDLIGFEGYLNDTSGTPFSFDEHSFVWKSDRIYHDFQPGNDEDADCTYPVFYYDQGFEVGTNVTSQMTGCRDSEFDQYGEVSAFGAYPDWQRQVSKFAFVQDRLREWRPDVLAKIQRFSCITIAMLDIDGFRMDKALQVTLDAQADWATYIRQCATDLGKDNFFIPGEVVDGNTFGSIYFGRGKLQEQEIDNLTEAVMTTNATNSSIYLREFGNSALDSAAFHYSIYRALTRFLGMDGLIGAVGDTDYNFVNAWHQMVSTNDMVNANTGIYDPRHLYGVTNQDVFRWPGLTNGTERQILGLFITSIHMPGIPLLAWGEEQAFYVLDNQASNYVYGRQPMSSALAWQMHGCYKLDEIWYNDMPFDSALVGCHDDTVSQDHRDSSHPVRNVIKRMYELREEFPVLNDGYVLTALSNLTHDVYLPGSGGTRTETGLWSVLRSRTEGVQDFSESGGQGNQSVWLIYQNEATTIDYSFNCTDNQHALIAPFPEGTTVKNLFYPYEEVTLGSSSQKLGFEGSDEYNGCLSNLSMKAWEFKAYVPTGNFVEPKPLITRVLPGHDSRIPSTVGLGEQEDVAIEIHFSANMSCESVTDSITINSTTLDGKIAQLDMNNITCLSVMADEPQYIGGVPTAWIFKANLLNVSNGVHTFTVNNVTTQTGNSSTNAIDHFMFRIGQSDNPIVFPKAANFSASILQKDASSGDLYVSSNAAGADKFRYSTNWGSSWSNWTTYENSSKIVLTPQPWSGTRKQSWKGEHVVLQYWSRLTGSSDHIQHAELQSDKIYMRRFPHIFTQGPWNQFGYDNGLANEMKLEGDYSWTYNFMAEWPSNIAMSVWGMNPSGLPDKTTVFGDIDGDGILDRVPPITLLSDVVNVTTAPPMPHLSWKVMLNDGTLGYLIVPSGSAWHQLILYWFMAIIPPCTAVLGVWMYKKSFYKVKHNEIGVEEKVGLISTLNMSHLKLLPDTFMGFFKSPSNSTDVTGPVDPLAADAGAPNRRTVLIATMEYEIEDWAIKIKIGGLGVMASLMGKNLGHQDLIWVVPCVGGIDYPVDRRAEPMMVTIFGEVYEVEVQYHTLRNITYVILDAPIFRQQSKAEPYPARMDDLDSAVYYSAWNACIAETTKRFNVDLYHINDYHGTLAPLYLLPRTIPVCLSLHNAEFQGLWPMRTNKEIDEVCAIYNLPKDVVQKYVQFGEVFNLLHAGASYLRIHQKGFGAVGVSDKYGVRSFARYPIFWGLSKIGGLPNPDPSDTADLDLSGAKKDISIDHESEAARGALRIQAQEWAGLEKNPDAELFVFVGRWSMQKGVDLIADVFPSVLEEHSNAQLICIGPVIDLYGRFAAIKLQRMMEKYPGRVCSKPEFTQLPPFIFSGAEFALIPSRDEPFGLVAVEFGRKGALGVGARVGGLGQMPGFWFTIESTTTKHLIHQFKKAISAALTSKADVRAMMRARSSVQRFPVATWVSKLEKLQTSSLEIHHSQKSNVWSADTRTYGHSHGASVDTSIIGGSRTTSMYPSRPMSEMPQSENPSRAHSRAPSGDFSELNRSLGPGSTDYTARENFYQLGRSTGSMLAFDQDGNNVTTSFNDVSRIQSHEVLPGHFNSEDIQMSSINRGGLNMMDNLELEPPYPLGRSNPAASSSVLSLSSVVGEKKDFKLQAVDPFFTDPTGQYRKKFTDMLVDINGKSSEDQLCIEEFLIKSEKQWFNKFHNAKLGNSPASSIFHFNESGNKSKSRLPWIHTRQVSSINSSRDNSVFNQEASEAEGFDSSIALDINEFEMNENYIHPTGLRKFLQQKIGDWPIYSFLLAFGQIIAANSYQVTLLIGQNGETAHELYIIASIYLASSAIWWVIYRHLKAIYVLSIPFLFYGLAFFLVGMAPYNSSSDGKTWIRYVATGFYAVASASGSLFFILNFGSEGGAPVKAWAFRACTIQGTQQIYVSLLWYWGDSLINQTSNGVTQGSLFTSSRYITAITVPIAALLWLVGILLFLGLPNYYRQVPGKVPSFYNSLFRRKIIGWFLIMVIIQNYWLSAPYGRNWRYLWSSNNAPAWSIVILLIVFFVFVWGGLLWMFGQLSKSHSWILPLFAIGLGAPRWCQMLWGTSNIGLYVPWAGSAVTGALVGRGLWLWLGVLDSIQGVGFGMILLQTLTRFHMSFTLIAAQILGSVATILARATAPNKIGPGDVFPDFSGGFSDGLGKAYFWLALAFQLVICVGFFVFFRKEQLSKP